MVIGKPSVFCGFTFFGEVDAAEPFESGTLFLPRFQIVKKNKNCCLIINFPLQQPEYKSQVIEKIEQQIESISWSDLEQLEQDKKSLLSVDREQSQDPDYFKSVVESALDSNRGGRIK